jgi:tripartite-type tricarboxylate transporter receptor subunit TctC
VARDRGAQGHSRRRAEDAATALKKVYDSKDYKEFMASRGFGVIWADPQETAKFMAASDANLGGALKAVGLAK